MTKTKKLYRVTIITSGTTSGDTCDHYAVLTLHEAKTVIEAWSHESLRNDGVVWNMATVEEFNPETKEWEDWYDEDGLDYEDTKQTNF